MALENIVVDRSGGVGIITLNRPRVLNAINTPLLTELCTTLVQFQQDDAIKAVILTGAGDRAFSAGADIHEQAQQTERASELWRTWTWYIASYPKPTIGALNGLVYGGAAQMVATLDIRIGCERTSFRFLYASVGRIVGTWVLPLVVGWARAKELLMTARVVEADEAYRIGLLNHLVSSEQLLATAVATGELIAKNHDGSVQGIKALMHEQVGMGYEEMYHYEQESRKSRFPSVPFNEAFKDFLARKPPDSAKT
jgi:enoyl-CoA hydratase/carnithine racemase